MPWEVAMALGFVGGLGLAGAIWVLGVMCRSHDEHCRAMMRRAGHGFQGTGGPPPEEGPKPHQLGYASGTVTGQPPRVMDDCAYTLSGCTSRDQAYRRAMADIKRTMEGGRPACDDALMAEWYEDRIAKIGGATCFSRELFDSLTTYLHGRGTSNANVSDVPDISEQQMVIFLMGLGHKASLINGKLMFHGIRKEVR